MFHDESLASMTTGSVFTVSQLTNFLAYGYNASINDYAFGADLNVNGITYSVACQRSYSFPMWTTTGARIIGFLDGVDKKLTIQNRNVDDKILYTGVSGSASLIIAGTPPVSPNPPDSLQFDFLGGDNLRVTNIDHSHEAGKNGMSSISLTQIVY
jgi:hypothetical protein